MTDIQIAGVMEKNVVMVGFDLNVMITEGSIFPYPFKEYAFFTDLQLGVNDLIVVDTNKGFSLARISKIRGLAPADIKKAKKWVVQKVDTSAFENRMKKQDLAQEIRNKLAKRKSEMEDILIYCQLGQTDPEIKKLLVELGGVDDNAKALLSTRDILET